MILEDKELMGSKYFSLINHELDTRMFYAKGGHDGYLGKLQVYEFDLKFLSLFCSCLESSRDYCTDDDEQRKEILRSMINLFKVIWPQDIQDFDPVTFGLEGKIQQSKTLIEQWCQILMRRSSSMQMQCRSSTNLNIMDFVNSVIYNVYSLLRYRASQIDPFKNQIHILKDMLQILDRLLSRIRECIDSNELHEYRNFVHAFSYNAACLICMYWANEENATEMNIALCDMLHKIKPCAAHVTASYFGVLKSSNLLQCDDSVSQGQTLASFVDFFFEHTVLKDDFLIFREWLIFLFTFLIDAAPHENAEEEDLIRSQIYSLLHEEDAYLLQPINELKEDIFLKKMLLSDFMLKIDILITKIIQLTCGASDSWNRLEVEKMNNINFASVQRELSELSTVDKDYDLGMAQLHRYLKELRFLRWFFQCFETWDDSDEETRVCLSLMVTSFQRIWGQEYYMGLVSGRLFAIRRAMFNGGIGDWKDLIDLELKEKFRLSKQEINAWLVSLSHCSFHFRPSTSNKILKFMDSILYNMSDLVTSGTRKDVAFKKQIEIFEDKLLLLTNLLKLATNCAYSKNLEEFNMLAQAFASNSACLICMYWANEANDEIPAETNLMLSNMLQKIKPDSADVARTYIGALKAICLQPYDSLLFELTVMSFVDYFFEDLTTPWKNDFQIFRDEAIFHLAFVHHHHTGNTKEFICSQLDVLFSGVYDLLPFDDMKGDFSTKKVGLNDFMMNIAKGNAKVRQLYCKFSDSFLHNFPKIIGQGFLDGLIQQLRNLKERMISDQNYVPSAKHKIVTIEEELISLTPIFNQILERKELTDAWLEVVNLVYLAEHLISLCFVLHHLFWHYIPYLSDVVDKIKALKTKLEKIEECNLYSSKCFPHSASLMHTLLEQDRNSEIHGVMVGFEEDENIIMDNITRGTESLDIVSIVGMGGIGKTTLAKKVYDSALVKSHFNILAFSSVSQDHNKKRLLLDILSDIVIVDAETSCMTEDDLAHKLKKRLSRQKYFIVLDDIWNINAWDEVRSSFPDDQNGSRVMLTTRSLEVAKRGQIKCTPHRLRFLTEDESWKLLQMKVFHNDMTSPNLPSVAKLIAKNCGGLPLAIVVIAGLLARTKENLWIEISKRVGSYLSDEVCMHILELSYKHLPEYLKPCLLYLGAFPEDSYYRVRQVTRLWIAEGFIKESETKSLNDVAKEYLYELADRSLIVVVKMIIGEIHTFRVHDLIHNFCQKKCRDGNFFQLGHGTATSSFSDPSIYNHYRVSVPKLCDITAADKLPLSCCHNRSLLYFPSEYNYSRIIFSLRKFKFAHVLSLKDMWLEKSDFAHVTSMIDLRHLEACVSNVQSIPSSISSLWNMQSLILRNMSYGEIALPENLWRMKSLRHVKVHDCKFEVSDGYELNAFPQLDKVVSFSRPRLSSGKDVEWLLLRLPAVRELNCILDFDSIDEPVETFGFHKKLESLKLLKLGTNGPCFINFPSTLIKLTLTKFELSSTAISSIGELHCLRILKLRGVSFPGATWEMEDMTLPNLKFFELRSSNLALWNANAECFPCLERLLFYDIVLEELPPCFGEISSLKKILISRSPKLTSSALRVHEEQMDWGNKVELIGCSDEQLNYEAKLADLGIIVGVCADISERGV